MNTFYFIFLIRVKICKCKQLENKTVFNQFTGFCSRSALHSMQPIEFNFSEGSAVGSASNTIQISMDCITMREPEEPLTVSTSFH